jgi:molybdate transport system ATP-binding protein
LPPQQRNVAYLFQDYALFPHLTCARTSASACAGWRNPRARDCRRSLARRVSPAGAGAPVPDELSGGQRQRWRWRARSWPQPAALLLDEPFAALDPALRVACAWS